MKKGFAEGSYWRADLDSRFGWGGWRPLVRFIVTQASGKLRAIDNATKSGQNAHTNMQETIYTISADWVAEACAVTLAELDALPLEDQFAPDMFDFELSTADLPDAYRGCPLAEADLGASILAIFDPLRKEYVFYQLLGLAYGLSSAVVSFNRLPTLLTAGVRRMYGVLCSAYFDDIPVVDVSFGLGSGWAALLQVLAASGAPPAPGKCMGPGLYRTFLGTGIRLADVALQGNLRLEARDATRHSICALIQEALSSRTLGSGTAAKLRGMLGWLATNSFGRIGRIGTFVLKQRQYGSDPGAVVHDALAACLEFLSILVWTVPPRDIALRSSHRRFLVVYSDAEFTPGRPPRLGWVAFWSLRWPPRAEHPSAAPSAALARTCLLDTRIVDLWCPRKTQIFAAEALAPSAALADAPAFFAGCDIMWYVDNEGACSTLIRGASSQEDVSGIAECTHILALRLGCRISFEWIDSKANPSDGLSREGLSCPLYGAMAQEARQPSWQFLPDHVRRLREVSSMPVSSLVSGHV